MEGASERVGEQGEQTRGSRGIPGYDKGAQKWSASAVAQLVTVPLRGR